MDQNIFLEMSAILGITVTIACFMRLLRQPLIVAYIVAGVIAGPFFLGIVNGQEHSFQVFAKFGIVLLLFIIGLSLNISHVKAMGTSVLIGGLAQLAISFVAGFGILTALGFSLLPSLFLGVAMSFASTIIVSKLLNDKQDTDTVYGRYTIGILLLQDIVAIGIMVLLNTITRDGGSWAETLLVTVSKGVLLIGLVALMAKYVLPFIMNRVARSSELLFIFTVTWCFGVASIVAWAGFSIEIGAIIAGISLGTSPYQPEIASRIRPLRDFFIVLFFIVLGSEMQLGGIQAALGPALLISLFVLIIDPIILYSVMRLMKYTRRNAFLSATTAAQVSEFGFILVFTAQELHLLQADALTIFTLVALTTIVISTYLITYNDAVYERLRPIFDLFGKDTYAQKERVREHYDAWVFGYHRIGWRVCEALHGAHISFAVVDFNPDVVKRLRAKGIPAYFGDAADVEFLEGLPLDSAKLMVSTIPEHDDQETLIAHARGVNPRLIILGNTYHVQDLEDLYTAGANYIMMPHLLGGAWMADILENKKWTKQTFVSLRKDQTTELKKRFVVRTDR